MYTLFLYKTLCTTGTAPCVNIINKTLGSYFSDAWQKNSAEKHIKAFDTSKVKDEIESRIGESYKGLYRLIIESSPKEKIEYIRILAQYKIITAIIGKILGVAIENDLVLYDAVKKRFFYYKDICDVDYLAIRERVCAFNNAIKTNMKSIYLLRKLGSSYGGRNKVADYVVTLRKGTGKSLEKRAEDFYNLLKDVLLKTEKINTCHRCFTIEGEYYQISYTLEAYSKCADRLAYIKDGQPCTELMHRMSCETAFQWAKNNINKAYKNYDYCMYKTEMFDAFPNPADRFVKGINIEKQIQREKFNMAYCGSFGGAIDFNVYFPWEIYDSEEISTLSIDEDDAIPLLEIIHEFYPYIYERFNEKNHLPDSMMRDIVEKMKEVRELLINDTYSDKLKPYLKNEHGFNYLVAYKDGAPVDELFYKNRIEFLHRHRFEAARLYDVFINWAEKQLETYCGGYNSVMFNVEGP